MTTLQAQLCNYFKLEGIVRLGVNVLSNEVVKRRQALGNLDFKKKHELVERLLAFKLEHNIRISSKL